MLDVATGYADSETYSLSSLFPEVNGCLRALLTVTKRQGLSSFVFYMLCHTCHTLLLSNIDLVP